MLSYIAVGTGAALISPPLITAVAHLIVAVRGSGRVEDEKIRDLLAGDNGEELEVVIKVASAMSKAGRRDTDDLRIAKEMLEDSVECLDTLYDRYHDAKEEHESAGWYAFWKRFDSEKWQTLLLSQNKIVEKRMDLVLKLR